MWFWRHKLSLVYITEKPSHPGVTTLKICNREGDTAPSKRSRIFREQTSQRRRLSGGREPAGKHEAGI
uniref:Uncharacterized protein n=1 Tax=Mustela putorius furo TaxID=9669 RepID=M3XWN3_MUSPF